MKARRVISALVGGGVERAFVELANFIVARDWDVVLATFENEGGPADAYLLDARVRRVRLGNPTPSAHPAAKLAANLRRAATLRRCLKRERPQVVLASMATAAGLATVASRRLGMRVVVAERTDPASAPVGRAWALARRRLYRCADAVVAQTRAAADWRSRRCACAVQVIPNALRALPSRFEGDPNVLLEAMGMGAAVVASDCRCGPSELVTPGHDGLLTKVGDATALAAALRPLVADAALRRRFGHAAVARRAAHEAGAVLGQWERLPAGGRPVAREAA